MRIREAIGKLDKTLLFMVVFVLIAVFIALLTGGGQLAFDGLRQTGALINSIWLRLLLGFALGGLVRVIIPSELIAKWLGNASGFKGILIGSAISVIAPDAPYIMMPVVAALYRAGAGVGPVVALITGRGLVSVQMLVMWQIPFLGVEIPLARYLVCLFIPPLAGLLGAAIYKMITRLSRTPDTGTAGDSTAEQDNIAGGSSVSGDKKE